MDFFKQNLISLLLVTIFTITMSLSGYIYSQDKKANDEKFKATDEKFTDMLLLINKEVSERKDEDDKLRDIIDNRVSYREFEILTDDVKETRADVKELLKKMDL